MNNKQVYWAYCCWQESDGRIARGFVLATNKNEAEKKAHHRVVIERRQIAHKLNVISLGPLPKRGRYRIRVWKDPQKTTAPATTRCYAERMAS